MIAGLDHTFRDPELLAQALTHASFAHENSASDNERLEFLGDAVLQLAATAMLVQRFPDLGEGHLSRMRQKLVRTDTLASLGRRLGLGPRLRLGVGEEATGGRDRRKVLAGAVEALLGAVFADGGWDPAERVVRAWLADAVDALERREHRDPKSLLQEQAQRAHGATPVYEVKGHDGPAHDPTYVVEVRVGDRVLGRGTGASKREASRRAAEAALATGPSP